MGRIVGIGTHSELLDDCRVYQLGLYTDFINNTKDKSNIFFMFYLIASQKYSTNQLGDEYSILSQQVSFCTINFVRNTRTESPHIIRIVRSIEQQKLLY